MYCLEDKYLRLTQVGILVVDFSVPTLAQAYSLSWPRRQGNPNVKFKLPLAKVNREV